MNRSFVIDLLKLLAAQAIVWHHLSAYGPMAHTIYDAWPVATDAFIEHSRLAVQVFLVMGGFLAAQAIRLDTPTPSAAVVGQWVWRRYLRLMPPYLVALLLITLVAWSCRDHISGDWLVDSPTWGAALAHALTLQGLLGLPSLSAGVWYVAMDFQLYVLLVLLLAAARTPRALSWAVLGLCAASMLFFNRHIELDNWALYFFGSYGLGVMAAWSRRSSYDAGLFALTVGVAIVALWLQPRIRLEVALATALVLPLAANWHTSASPGPMDAPLGGQFLWHLPHALRRDRDRECHVGNFGAARHPHGHGSDGDGLGVELRDWSGVSPLGGATPGAVVAATRQALGRRAARKRAKPQRHAQHADKHAVATEHSYTADKPQTSLIAPPLSAPNTPGTP